MNGMSIADAEALSKDEKAVDAVSGATLVDTAGYVGVLVDAANGWMALFVQMGERKRTAVRFRQPSVLGRYSFPHCLPVKKRRGVVARNTLPARSTVEGNSG